MGKIIIIIKKIEREREREYKCWGEEEEGKKSSRNSSIFYSIRFHLIRCWDFSRFLTDTICTCTCRLLDSVVGVAQSATIPWISNGHFYLVKSFSPLFYSSSSLFFSVSLSRQSKQAKPIAVSQSAIDIRIFLTRQQKDSSYFERIQIVFRFVLRHFRPIKYRHLEGRKKNPSNFIRGNDERLPFSIALYWFLFI